MAKETKKNINKVKNKKYFFKNFKAELKKVIWPTPKQLVNNTIAVITIVLVTVVIVLVLDLFFEFVSEKGINQIKENIKNSTTSEIIDDSIVTDDNNIVTDNNIETENVTTNSEEQIEE